MSETVQAPGPDSSEGVRPATRRRQVDTEPRPARTRKQHIFNVDDYEMQDARVVKVPARILDSTFDDLAAHLVSSISGELGRVRALFYWSVTVAIDNIQARHLSQTSINTPRHFLFKMKKGKANYAHLFHKLCQAADIKCEIVKGLTKNASYEVGQALDVGRLASQWNAALIDGEWRLFDLLWAAKCVIGKTSNDWKLHEDGADDGGDTDAGTAADDPDGAEGQCLNEFYFLTDADQFIWTHLPDDPAWQLLERPISREDFQHAVYLRERFFDLRLSLQETSHKSAIIYPEHGEATITFTAPSEGDSSTEFHQLLYLSKDTSVPGSAQFITFNRTDTTITFHLDIPYQGRFRLEIYGRDPANVELELFDLICSYLVICENQDKDIEIIYADESLVSLLKHNAHHLSEMGGVISQDNDMVKVVIPRPKLDRETRIELQKIGGGPMPEGVARLIRNPSVGRRLYEEPPPIGEMVKLCSQLNGLVRSSDGRATIRIKLMEDADVLYHLYNARDAVTMTTPLADVTSSAANGEVRIEVRLRESGEFLLDTFRRFQNDSRIHHIKTYLIDYSALDDV